MKFLGWRRMTNKFSISYVPKLRFPEFQFELAWKSKLLKNMVKNITTGKLDANAMVEGGQYRFYTCAKNFYFINEYAFDTEALLISGNGAHVGYIHHYQGKFNAYQRTYVLFGFDTSVIFLKFYLERNLAARILTEKKEGNTPYIVMGTIAEMPILMPPSTDEQQKIADCLSSIDELIVAQAQKLNAFKLYKKGMMQKLFPVKGETIPELRFPEFRDEPAWVGKRMDKVCWVNPPAKQLPKSFVYIDLESVKAGVLLQKNHIKLNAAPSRAQRLLKNGDIIFQMVRPYQKNNYFLQTGDNFNCVASTGYAQLRAHQVKAYIFHLLHTDRFVNKVLTKCTGSNYPAINSNDFSKIIIEIPEPPEQQKIADILSIMDELIFVQTQKLNVLKSHKKGLMQKLFPSIEKKGA